MPSLGFLKRRRTKEAQSDRSSNAQAKPGTGSSPPKEKLRNSAGAAAGAGGGGQASAAAISGAMGQQQQQQTQSNSDAAAAAATTTTTTEPRANILQQPPHPPAQATTTTASAARTAASSGSDPQQSGFSKPTYDGLENTANATQADGAAVANSSNPDSLRAPPFNDTTTTAATTTTANNNDSSHSASPPGRITPGGTTSPGTDPSLLQKQPQAAHPPPSQQAAMHPVQQQPQQPQQQTQHHVAHHQHSASQSTPRVTKGKYTLTDFDIQRTLGTGSFGRVHLVQSKHNHRFYAIKVLKKAQVVKMKQVEHTNDERRMLSDVKHPFLVTLWGTFQDWKNIYMVMDFVEGGELFSLLRKSGRFPNPVAKFYAAEVTLALEYLHSKNIIYRDLKPENLLLDRHGHLKITDFGFAKRVPDKTWTLCGTPDYLAPEVVSNKGYNKSVDWWSLGILIYEMLCGYTPFWDSGSPMRIYENILKGKIKYPAYIVPEAQDLLQRLITADLTKRLGNLYGGSADVKSHPWFHEVTWDRLARKDIDAPYTPSVKAGTGDASQFDNYPEEQEKYGTPGGTDEYGNLFTEF